jgi:hypothetical protein
MAGFPRIIQYYLGHSALSDNRRKPGIRPLCYGPEVCAALAAGAAMLLADGGAVFAPVTGMVGGIAAMALANHERLKLRIEVLEKRLAEAEWRGQPRRLNSGAGNLRFRYPSAPIEAPACLVKPKNRGPDQCAPVIRSAITVSE